MTARISKTRAAVVAALSLLLTTAGLQVLAPSAQAVQLPNGLVGICTDASGSGTYTGHIAGYAGSGGAITVPGTITDDGNTCPVTLINAWSLHDKGITSVALPSQVTDIGNYALSGNPLESITFNGPVWVSAASIAPSKPGHTFTGWFTAPTGGAQVTWSGQAPAGTMYARYEVNQYTTTFNFSDGGTTPQQSAQYPYLTSYTDITLPAAPARQHYVSEGWYTHPTAGFPVTSGGTVYGNTTFYLRWTAAQYNVTFDANGGSAVASTTTTYPEALSSPNSTRDHYTLAGWETSGGTLWNFSDPIDADMTLTARWTPDVYGVTFDSAGGSAVAGQNITFPGTATEPADPTRDHYSFDYWASAGGAAWDFATTVTEPLTLTSQWIPDIYTVTFDSAGGTPVADQSVTYPDTATAPPVPSRADYVFTGWVDSSDTPWDFATTVTDDTALTATWTTAHVSDAHFTYTADPASGTFTVTGLTPEGATQSELMVPATITVGAQNFALRFFANHLFAPGSPIEAVHLPDNSHVRVDNLHLGQLDREHHTFDGWWIATGPASAFESPLSAYFSTTQVHFLTHFGVEPRFEPRFTPHTYTVTFDSAGGSAVAPQDVTYPAPASAPVAPTKDHYTFSGWSDAASQPWTFLSIVTGHTLLTAQWTPVEYTVTFDPANGTAPWAATAAYPAPPAEQATPFLSGHTFSHWELADGSVWDASATVSEDLALTAVYTENERILRGPSSATQGEQITLTGNGFDPYETIAAELHSTPVSLGRTTADASGTFTLAVTIPADTAPGDHTLVLTAGSGTAEQAFTVTAAPTAESADGETTSDGGSDTGASDAPAGAQQPALASTGAAHTRTLAFVAFLLLAAGAAALIIRRKA
ncbi:InlB B-repeat-containing protein [Demequina sp. B12]|uniref:InlB B-repeat-containing protein n=1 Tax=Demequina sp. B12 TaxID=2992757 RepID=UPI00237AD05F|nr:InlB B-repeat-containing protein [Demequina sp. B12]MDE0573563.1 InlB B-repeat-containing protein [Demequina sp. B12]